MRITLSAVEIREMFENYVHKSFPEMGIKNTYWEIGKGGREMDNYYLDLGEYTELEVTLFLERTT